MATAPAPWDSDPVVGGAQPAPAAPVSASPDAPWESDPTVQTGGTRTITQINGKPLPQPIEVPVDASDEDVRRIALQHGLHVDQNSVVLNSQAGQQPQESLGQQILDNAKNDVAGIAQGAAALPDMAAGAAGKIMSIIPNLIGHALELGGHTDAAKWIQDTVTHNLANPVQVGNVIENLSPTPSTTSGHVNRAIGNLVGGVAGTPTSAIEHAVTSIAGEAPEAIAAVAPKAAEVTPEQEAAQAAQDLNIDLPAFAVKGPAAQAAAAKLTRRAGFGATDLGKSAQTAIDQSQAAKDSIVGSVAEPQELDATLGGNVKNAAVDARTAERARIGRMFDAGDEQMGNVPIALNQTRQALGDLVEEDNKALVPGPVTSLVKQMQQRINDLGGSTTAANLRSSIQNLKAQMTTNAVDAKTSDHIISTLRDAMNGDLEVAAKQSGNEDALQTYQDAREQWAASKMLDKTTLKPLLGSAFQNTGDQVINALKTAVKNNGTRVAQFLNAVPEDVANTARASLLSRMGMDNSGNFNLAQLADNWNALGGSRKLVFAPETVQAMDKLASVAKLGKPLQAVAQNGAKAAPFGLKKLMTSGPAALGEAAFMFTHDVKDVAIGTAVSALGALGQWRSAKLLADPGFAKRLAAMPTNPKAAVAYWSRPWVRQLQLSSPALAGEIQRFQQYIIGAANDTMPQTGALAASPNQRPQQQQ